MPFLAESPRGTPRHQRLTPTARDCQQLQHNRPHNNRRYGENGNRTKQNYQHSTSPHKRASLTEIQATLTTLWLPGMSDH